MTAYVIHRSKGLRTVLDRVMPGAAWEQRPPKHLRPANAEDVAADAAAVILDHLRKVPEGIDSVACRVVSKALGIEHSDAAKQAFKRGGALIESFCGEWAKVGSSFKRGAARCGFTDQTALVI